MCNAVMATPPISPVPFDLDVNSCNGVTPHRPLDLDLAILGEAVSKVKIDETLVGERQRQQPCS